MTFTEAEIGRVLTRFGAVVEAIGFVIVVFDYGWHENAKRVEAAITKFASEPFRSLWTRIFKVYSGDKPIRDESGKVIGESHGELTVLGALFSVISFAIGVWMARLVREHGTGMAGSVGVGLAATF